ncbi:cell division protein FtsQ/DivIB [Anaplasma bovis]|uniref:cell division protein FtsQ/DivIB n=1 Tax=Anaplasma bovis TaxID=186733 RepID=UPI002FEFD5E9
MSIVGRMLYMYKSVTCTIRECGRRVGIASIKFCRSRGFAIALGLVLVFAAGGGFLYQSRTRAAFSISDVFLALGFSVKEIVIKGNSAVTDEQILRVIENQRSIVLLPLNELCERIKKQSPWIKKVSISRVIPSGVLNVSIVEYEAFANWYHGGINSIIDDTGYVILDHDRRYENLISIYGENAVQNLAFIKRILGSGDELSTMISSFVFADGGKCSIDFSSGLRVKFSQHDADVVWNKLVGLYEASSGILMQKIIDMDALSVTDERGKA